MAVAWCRLWATITTARPAMRRGRVTRGRWTCVTRHTHGSCCMAAWSMLMRSWHTMRGQSRRLPQGALATPPLSTINWCTCTAAMTAGTAGMGSRWGSDAGGMLLGCCWDVAGMPVGRRWDVAGMPAGCRWDAGAVLLGCCGDAGGVLLLLCWQAEYRSAPDSAATAVCERSARIYAVVPSWVFLGAHGS
eukprot:350435-Chlamydomonas_euryale.AAC.4